MLEPTYRGIEARQEPITYKHAVLISLSMGKKALSAEEGEAYAPLSQCSYLAAITSLKLAGHVGDAEFCKDAGFYGTFLPQKLAEFEQMVRIEVFIR